MVADRRNFIKAFGGLPLAYYFGSDPVFAQSKLKSPNVLCVYTPHGAQHNHWLPEGNQTNFKLATSLAPLDPYRDDLNIFWGLRNASADSGRDTHVAGMAASFSTNGKNDMPSFDTIMGDYYKQQSNVIRACVQSEAFPGAASTPSPKRFWFSRDSDGAPIPMEKNPAIIYREYIEKIATQANPSASTGSDGKWQQDAIERANATNRKIKALGKGLSQADYKLLDQFVSFSSSLSSQMAPIEIPSSFTGPAPNKPQGLNLNNPDSAPQIAKHHMDLLIYALYTGVTKVAALNFFSTGASHPCKFVRRKTKFDHHQLSHKNNRNLLGTKTLNENEEDYVNIHVWFSKQIAYMAAKLSEYPGPNGGTMLDDTIIIWGHCQGTAGGNPPDSRPNNFKKHSQIPFQFITIGGKNSIKTGNFFNFSKGSTRTQEELFTTIYRRITKSSSFIGDPSQFKKEIAI